MRSAIIQYKIRADVDVDEFESFMRTTDIPAVTALPSVIGHRFQRVVGAMPPDAPPAFSYVEVLEVSDFDTFKNDPMSPTMAPIAEKFAGYLAGPPVFLLLEDAD